MDKKTSFWGIGLSLLLFFIVHSLAFADPVVVGNRIEFSSLHPRLGETITLTVRFTVEGGPVDICINSIAHVINPPGSPIGPMIVGDRFITRYSSGANSTNLRFVVPTNVPNKICLSIVVSYGDLRVPPPPQTIIDNACLEASPKNKAGTLNVAGNGTGYRVTIRVPDLVIPGTGPSTSGINLYVRNAGTERAEGIVVRFEYQLGTGSRWILIENRTIDHLNPSDQVTLSFRNPSITGPRPPSGINFRHVVDPENLITESREDNNILAASTRTP